MLIELFGLLAYNLTAAIFGFIGAYCGVLKRRNSMISAWEALAILLLTWLIGSIAEFMLLVLFATFGLSIKEPFDLLLALAIFALLGRRMIVYLERRKAYQPQQ